MTIRRKANKFSTIRTGNSYAVKKETITSKQYDSDSDPIEEIRLDVAWE